MTRRTIGVSASTRLPHWEAVLNLRDIIFRLRHDRAGDVAVTIKRLISQESAYEIPLLAGF